LRGLREKEREGVLCAMDNFSVIGISPFFHKNVLSENMLEKTLDFGFKKELRDVKKGSMMGAYAF